MKVKVWWCYPWCSLVFWPVFESSCTMVRLASPCHACRLSVSSTSPCLHRPSRPPQLTSYCTLTVLAPLHYLPICFGFGFGILRITFKALMYWVHCFIIIIFYILSLCFIHYVLLCMYHSGLLFPFLFCVKHFVMLVLMVAIQT